MSELALQLINENKKTKSPFLDLGKCGLRSLPKELFACEWLEELILSNRYWDIQKAKWIESYNVGNNNTLSVIPDEITGLKKLNTLKAGGDYRLGWNISNNSVLGKMPGLKSLGLSFNGISDISFLQNLTGLQALDLRFNRISDISFLEKLTELQTLDFSSNRISDISFLGKLTLLQTLDLSANNISDIRFLEKLTDLETLNLSSNSIYKVHFLRKLSALQTLDLSFNNINGISFLEKLTGLKTLNLSSILNSFEWSFLAKLIGLRTLYLRQCSISDISFLEKLSDLQNLDLAFNSVQDLSFLKDLTGLQTLDLQSNWISDIKFLEKLTDLGTLDLRNNRIKRTKELMPLVNLPTDISISLDSNKVLKEIPQDVVQAGWPAIRERLLALQQEEKFILIKEVKLLLLGNTRVGKSNLLEYFETGKEPQLDSSTHGIQYRSLNNVIEEGIINCWDFGGQDYYHTTHQLFFSPGALNIILWCKENDTEAEKEECFDIPYWLRCIEQIINNFYGGDNNKKIEVIICENKIDLQGFRPEPMNQLSFREKFPNLTLHFTSINLKPLRRMEGFKEFILERSKDLFVELQYSYYEYLSVIRDSSYPFILIKNTGPGKSEKFKTAMKVFHNMGVLLYFPHIIPEKVFTKPQLLLDLLYDKILSREKKSRKSTTEISEAIDGNELELDLEQVLLLLKHFDLVFQIPKENDIYFIPQYLRNPSSSIEFFTERDFAPANIRIESDHYLMNLAMLKVYANYGRYVKEERKDEYFFWKDGIVIQKDEQLLMIKFDRKAQAIELFPSKPYNNFDLQHELVNFIISISEKPGKAGVEEWKEDDFTVEKNELNWRSSYFDVYVSADGTYFMEWIKLIEELDKGFDKVEAIQNNRTIKTPNAIVSKLIPVHDFKRFLPESIKVRLKKRVFISYSHVDAPFREEIEKYLANNIRDELIEIWHDGSLDAGDVWDDKIDDNLQKADICVMLLTQDFINSDYVNKKELKIILNKSMKENCRILPVLLKECDWENWKAYPANVETILSKEEIKNYSISSFQFLPLDENRRIKPVNKWAHPEDAYKQVADTIRAFCIKNN